MPSTDAQPQSPKRRYLALLARARDQAGKPEGDLCQRLADEMSERWPDLLDVDEVQPVAMFEFRWKAPHERELLIRAAKYFGCDPQGWAGRRSRTKAVLVETDATTRDLIEHAYESQRKRLAEVIRWAASGYLCGSMPLPRVDGDSSEASEVDDELLELALAAQRMGRQATPIPALTEAELE